MGVYWQWVSSVRRKFTKSSHHRTIIINETNNTEEEQEGQEAEEKDCNEDEEQEEVNTSLLKKKKKIEVTEEDIAAIKIQAVFRGNLARKAFRALRSLVKLQALVRGVQVRKQSRIALHCMHALVRLHVTVRARQLLSTAGVDQ